MVTVIFLALSTSVGSVISVIPISDVTSAACPTITNARRGRRTVRGQEWKEENEGEEKKGREGGIRCRTATSHESTQTRK